MSERVRKCVIDRRSQTGGDCPLRICLRRFPSRHLRGSESLTAPPVGDQTEKPPFQPGRQGLCTRVLLRLRIGLSIS
eukprot:14812940-Heterocapsa_arctica.AAC.1